jgi:colanic acid biosynthesis glycosyl transferase WcaI
MRFTILTQYYPPEIGAPQNRLSDLAGRLVAAGHEVEVFTAMPSYPRGKIYPGYGGLFSREQKDGVRILRTFIYPTRSARFLPRLLNYFSFMFSSAFLGSFLLRRADYLLIESPPLFLGMSAMWLSWLKRAKLIFNVSDLWPDSAVHLGIISKNSRAYAMSSRLESFCYRHAWLVTGQSNGILNDIRARFPAMNTFLLSNGSDTQLFTPERRTVESRNRLANGNKFVVLYAGLHGLAQGLDQILEAANELTASEIYRFVFIGDGPEKHSLIVKAGQQVQSDIEFMDPLPKHEIPELLAAADVLLIPLACDIPGAVPSKLYEAMASGRPLVLVATGEPAQIVRQYQAGLIVPPGDVALLVQAIRTLRAEPDKAAQFAANARRAAVEHYDRAQIAESFIEYLEDHHDAALNKKYEPGYQTDWSAGK